jgi:predicted DNA-binding ribbon-helix-helix protein
MKSSIRKRSIVVGGHKTSISLEDAFWNDMKMIAREREVTLSELVSSIDVSRVHGNLSSAIRLFVLYAGCRRAASHHTAAICIWQAPESSRHVTAVWCHPELITQSGGSVTPSLLPHNGAPPFSLTRRKDKQASWPPIKRTACKVRF